MTKHLGAVHPCLLAIALYAAYFSGATAKAQEKKSVGVDAKTWNTVVDKGVDFLKASQAKDGTWSKATSPGISGLVLTGMFRCGKITAADPVAVNGLKFIESMVDEKEGHIALGNKIFHRNYITSVNLMALKSANAGTKYSSVITAAANYLKKLQWDEGEEKTPKDLYYGGTGYGPGTRPDLSNSQFFIDAVKAAGTPSDDPVYKKALVFVSRCQNLKSEYNDQPWAAKINDGSFIYVLGAPKKGNPDDPRPGSGGMTAAGLKCLIICGAPKDDLRVKKAMEWLAKNYTVEANPGNPSGSEMKAYYYYLATLAKCMAAMEIDEFVDAKGVKHDWRAEVLAALASRQRKDGSWSNETTGFQEGNPDLCTAFALITLSYARPMPK